MLNVARFACLLLLAAGAVGCTSAKLASARRNFYDGDLQAAEAALQELPEDEGNRVLYLMERGTIRQARTEWQRSSLDYLDAVSKAEQLDYYSVSQGTASFVVNDRVKAYRGAPYERTLLHAFAAKDFLAMGLWDDAGVEARNIVDRLENLDGFPDDPYSRYVAAVSFELMGSYESAAFQYRQLAGRVTSPEIDPESGRFKGAADGATRNELICFVLIGRAPTESGTYSQRRRWGPSPYPEIYAGDRRLGRSHTFVTTQDLLAATEKRLATMKVVKTASRVVIKDTLANAVARENELLGGILWMLLFAAERPDTRRWETLPAWLQVARVPCPAELNSYRVVFRSSAGVKLGEKTVQVPLQRRGNVYVSFVRDFP